MKKLKFCPICGESGEDIVFKFYCTNRKCRNYKEGAKEVADDKEKYNDDDFIFWPHYEGD